ncbi:hypothetical protein N9D44_02610, partial [Pontimonas sp.]|nr:hypothetical protein [Pontimonas sp.]
MSPRIGAIMRGELWEAFAEACKDIGCDAVLLSDGGKEAADPPTFDSIDAVVAELSEHKEVVDLAQRAQKLYLPIAGIALEDNIQSPALEELCEVVLSSREDVAAWVQGLSEPEIGFEKGSLTVVCGAHGAPGRTTVTLSLARELSKKSAKVVVIDADHSAPSLGFLLAVPQDISGFQAALRSARVEGVDINTLLTPMVLVNQPKGAYRLLSAGISPWEEKSLDQKALERLLSRLVEEGFHCVLDTAAISTGTTHRILEITAPLATHVVGITHPSDVGVTRFIRAWSVITALAPDVSAKILVRAPRKGLSLSGDAIRQTLWEYTDCEDISFLDNPTARSDQAESTASPAIRALG